MGPLRYVLYTAPVADIIKSHNLQYHFYADDTQLYVTFKTNCDVDAGLSRSRVEHCVADIDRWMTNNELELNGNKIEPLVISAKYRSRPMVTSIQLRVETIKQQPLVRNLGVILDQDIAMDKHISMMCKTSQHHLRNIGNIRGFLDKGSAETLVHSFVTSKIDYCNALFFGLPKYQINRLHLVLNTAARVVTPAYKYEHITPVMKSLHWLPVSQSITFKISLLIYKATQRLGAYLSIRPIGSALL